MGITEFLAVYITRFIDATGFITVYIAMVMESMFLPVPSEAVMPFAGFLIAEGRFTFAGVVAVSTLGSITGSLISYFIGKYGGKPFVKNFGKFVLIDMEELEMTEKFFQKHGELAVFICRFIPVVRHLISIPAGVGQMKLLRFTILTIIGAGIWNSLLAFAGYILKQNWDIVIKYSKIVDVVIILILAALVAFYIFRHLKKRSKQFQKP